MDINRISKSPDLPSSQAPEKESNSTSAPPAGIADTSSQIENPVQNAISDIWNHPMQVSTEGKSGLENSVDENEELGFEKKKAEVANMYDSVSQSIKSKFDKLIEEAGDNPAAVSGLQLDLKKELGEVEERKKNALAQLQNVKQETLQNSDSIERQIEDFKAWRLGGSE